jgi:hypothetical protein
LNERLENAQTTILSELIFNSPNEETTEQRIPFTFEVGRTSFHSGSLVGLYSERDKIGFENLEEFMVNWKESKPQFPYQSMEYEPSNEKYSPSRSNTLETKNNFKRKRETEELSEIQDLLDSLIEDFSSKSEEIEDSSNSSEPPEIIDLTLEGNEPIDLTLE